ncbi:MAG: cytochrome c biogenesis protein ResB [Candidatus Eremiobacteraeota bacterium]|nr:cytochrome c biogenesis protein ResB [Candidatus Eremiobacteraeota bacterium]
MAAAVEQLRAGARETLEDLLRLFSSIYFAVSLFAVWGFLTLIGVIVDQGKDPQFYWTNYSPALARLVLRLHLDNIYHGTLYVGVIGAIVASLAVCTFRRVIPARLPPLRPVRIEHIPLNATLALEGEESTIRERLERFLRERGWQIRKREFGGEEWTFADKHNWARRGVLVAHIGFAIITAGTTWYWAQGFSGDTAIVTGETQTIPQTGARIRLEHFGYRFDPIKTKSGLIYQPIDYVSQVRYAGRDNVWRDATIRVNQPLDIDGTLYYQATYGFATEFSLLRNGKPIAGVPAGFLKEGQALEVGPGRGIEYSQFVGTIDRKTGRATNDPRPNDPGVVVRIVDGERVLGAALLPIGGSIDLGRGFRLSAPRFVVYSGIQYRYDPGMVLVGIGAFVLLSGLCIAFYFLPARLFLRLIGNGSKWELGVAATTVKGYDVFEDQFRELVGALGRCN